MLSGLTLTILAAYKAHNNGQLHRTNPAVADPAGVPAVPTTLLPTTEDATLDGWRYLEGNVLPIVRTMLVPPYGGISHRAPGHRPNPVGVLSDTL